MTAAVGFVSVVWLCTRPGVKGKAPEDLRRETGVININVNTTTTTATTATTPTPNPEDTPKVMTVEQEPSRPKRRTSFVAEEFQKSETPAPAASMPGACRHDTGVHSRVGTNQYRVQEWCKCGALLLDAERPEWTLEKQRRSLTRARGATKATTATTASSPAQA